MSSESRITPRSNKTRYTALNTGKAKNTAMGAASFISTTTQGLLTTIQLLYYNAMGAVRSAKAVFFNATVTKDKNAVSLEMVCSHFIQVFVFGVARGVFSVGDLAYYDLTLDGKLPDMRTDALRLEVAKILIDGDAKRMLVPHAVPMAMPAIADVATASVNFTNSGTAQNSAKEVVQAAQVACNGYNLQADQCIKLLWGEVETHNVNLPRPTMRANSILWGVKYARVGGLKIITGTVTDFKTGKPIEGAIISFVNGNKEAESDVNGDYSMDTTLMDIQELTAEHPLYTNFTVEVTLVEGENQVVNIVMTLA